MQPAHEQMLEKKKTGSSALSYFEHQEIHLPIAPVWTVRFRWQKEHKGNIAEQGLFGTGM